MRPVLPVTLVLLFVGASIVAACGDDDDDDDDGRRGSPDNTGKVCAVADECYPDVDRAALKGTALCLDKIDEGYCTHVCAADADCCAAPGECKTALKQVCSPFESAGQKMCFLSCEGADLGGRDEQEFCQKEASPDFICRSSGGGSDNRKICVPGDCNVGESCGADVDCAPGLACVLDFRGGYCGKKGCASSSECPNGSRCVTNGDGNYCLRTCQGPADCQLCRGADVAAACTAEVTYAQPGESGSVCVPSR
jgi:hypothetical protein